MLPYRTLVFGCFPNGNLRSVILSLLTYFCCTCHTGNIHNTVQILSLPHAQWFFFTVQLACAVCRTKFVMINLFSNILESTKNIFCQFYHQLFFLCPLPPWRKAGTSYFCLWLNVLHNLLARHLFHHLSFWLSSCYMFLFVN